MVKNQINQQIIQPKKKKKKKKKKKVNCGRLYEIAVRSGPWWPTIGQGPHHFEAYWLPYV
jgi:hypothetical protein